MSYRLSVTLVGLLVAAGCAPKDEITVYTAPSEPRYPDVRKPVTLLAAMVPETEKRMWVFKVAGPSDEIAAERSAILDFLKTVKFAPDAIDAAPKEKDDEHEPRPKPQLQWKLPAGWVERDAGGEFRYKSISIPRKGDWLDLSVSLLDKRGGRILPNVNRWRGQIYREPISDKELPLVSKKMEVAGVEAWLIEMKGYKYVEPEEQEPFEYQLPVGWRKGKKTQFALLSFLVDDGKDKAGITVSVAGGKLDDNLNRWREQVGLPKLDASEVVKEAKKIVIDGHEATYVDYGAAKDGDRAASRILGAVLPLDDRFLFVKMTGPTGVVGREKENFERFARSLKPAKKDQ